MKLRTAKKRLTRHIKRLQHNIKWRLRVGYDNVTVPKSFIERNIKTSKAWRKVPTRLRIIVLDLAIRKRQ